MSPGADNVPSDIVSIVLLSLRVALHPVACPSTFGVNTFVKWIFQLVLSTFATPLIFKFCDSVAYATVIPIKHTASTINFILLIF